MKKIIILFFALISFQSFGQNDRPPYNDYNIAHRDMHSALPPITHKDIVMLGNSITDRCIWSELFNNPHVKNRGISADRVEWIGDRIDPIINGHPKKLFLMIGVNDLGAGRSPEDVASDIENVIQRFKQGSPKTTIYVQSILPYNTKIREKGKIVNPQIIITNELLKEICLKNGIVYIDLHTIMKDENGDLKDEYTVDGLHLNGKSYTLWAETIRKYVK